ncbi:unnamed protein product [Prunus brigantina]
MEKQKKRGHSDSAQLWRKLKKQQGFKHTQTQLNCGHSTSRRLLRSLYLLRVLSSASSLMSSPHRLPQPLLVVSALSLCSPLSSLLPFRFSF